MWRHNIFFTFAVKTPDEVGCLAHEVAIGCEIGMMGDVLREKVLPMIQNSTIRILGNSPTYELCIML